MPLCSMLSPPLASSDDVHVHDSAKMVSTSTGSQDIAPDVAPDHAEERIKTWSEHMRLLNHCTYPSFMKTLRSSCKRNANQFRVEIPAQFVKHHGHNFQATVVLHGPIGRFTVAHLRIQSNAFQDRVHFSGAGWRTFVVENGLKLGHQLIFSLVSKSTFVVRHFSGSAAKVANIYVDRGIQRSSSGHGMNPAAKVAKTRNRPSGRQLDGVPRSSARVPCVINSFENIVPLPNDKNDVVYAPGTLRVKHNVTKLVEKLQCPHFVTEIRKSNLLESRSSALSVPHTFMDRYGAYVSEWNVFQGATGRQVEVRFSAGARNLRFTSGWKAFHKENHFKLGDVLLFSLQAPACWLVQVVERREKKLMIETKGNRSDLA